MQSATPAPAHLSDQTWNDLLLDDTLDLIDSSLTSLGSQFLYQRLRIPVDRTDRERFEKLVTRFAEDQGAREHVQRELLRLQRSPASNLWILARANAIDPRWWWAAFPVLLVVIVSAGAASVAVPRLFPLLFAALAIGIGLRGILYFRAAALLYPLRTFAPITDVAGAIVDAPGLFEPEVVAATRSAVEALRPLRSILRWMARDPMMYGEVLGIFFEYVNLFFLLDGNALYFVARRLRHHHTDVFRLLTFLGRVDAALSVASLRARSEPWCVPAGDGQRSLAIVGARHPLVERAVPNTIAVDPGRGTLVTGSNMSGKSTYLRAAGVAAVLARAINTCPAESYSGPIVDVSTCLRSEDDLLTSRSSYYVQAETIVEMMRQSRDPEPRLFLLDEVFRGTNTVERIAAAEAALIELQGDAISPPPLHYVVAATHDGELVPLLEGRYEAVHFEDEVVDGALRFTHRLAPGPAQSRSALRLLGLLGAPRAMLDRAERRAGQLSGGA